MVKLFPLFQISNSSISNMTNFIDMLFIVLEPSHGVCAVGSGGPLARAAALALIEHGNETLSAEDIARKSLAIAGSIDIYTNGECLTVQVLGDKAEPAGDKAEAATNKK